MRLSSTLNSSFMNSFEYAVNRRPSASPQNLHRLKVFEDTGNGIATTAVTDCRSFLVCSLPSEDVHTTNNDESLRRTGGFVIEIHGTVPARIHPWVIVGGVPSGQDAAFFPILFKYVVSQVLVDTIQLILWKSTTYQILLRICLKNKENIWIISVSHL